MKHFLITIAFLLVCSVTIFAQTIPQGMKYQAVARDHSGKVLPNQKIALKITLYSEKNNSIEYSEIHRKTTNQLGLFSLTIGEGESKKGTFEEVPWSTQNIWMELAIDENGGADFFTISNSKLLAVPYAFHAATASALVDNDASGSNGGEKVKEEKYWLIGGNEFENLGTPNGDPQILGTNTLNDLLIVTNGQPAIIIDDDEGTVGVVGDVEIGNDLSVQNNTTIGGATHIIGTLDVEGATTLNTSLDVANEAPTILGGTLVVKDFTDLNRGLNVNNEHPTNLSGTLDVDGIATIQNTTESTSPSNGALHVLGGIGVEKRVNVAGIATIQNTTESTSPSNGALHVLGGIGVEKNVNVGGDVKIDKTLNVVANGTAGALNGNVASFENTVNGNGIQIKVGAAVPHNNNNFITFLNGNGTPVGRIEGENGGADLANNLWYQGALGDADVDIDLANNGVTLAETDLQIAGNEELVAIADVAIAAADLVVAGAEVVASATSSTACGGVGACVTSPIPSFITSAGVGLGIAIANQVSVVANLALVTQNKESAQDNLNLANEDLQAALDNKQGYIDLYEETIGVSYVSGAGDYAEYLPKLNIEDDFIPGDVVGMKNGLISRNTLNADRIMVISFKPAVLGALPEAGTEANFEKVAFLGQIPTKVYGKVNKGDYILPSGFHNLSAIAKHPDEMLLTDYKKILGVAWEGAESEGINYVNVAVGLNVNDFSEVIVRQQAELKALENQIAQNSKQLEETQNVLAEIIPGFREATGWGKSKEDALELSYESVEVHDTENHDNEHKHGQKAETEFLTQHDVVMVQPDLSNIVYYVPERAEYEQWIELARQEFIRQNIPIDTHPFFKRLDTDPDYLEEVILEMEKRFETTIHYHVEIDKD